MPFTTFKGSAWEKECLKMFNDLLERRKSYEDEEKRLKANLKDIDKKELENTTRAPAAFAPFTAG